MRCSGVGEIEHQRLQSDLTRQLVGVSLDYFQLHPKVHFNDSSEEPSARRLALRAEVNPRGTTAGEFAEVLFGSNTSSGSKAAAAMK